MTEPTDHQSAVAAAEQKVRQFWRDNDIFTKSLKAREGKASYVFYDGPPFATGTPHYGHLLASAIKDAVPRYQTMRGKYVPRRWGWDCHGLPIENIVEKDLGISGRKEIEQLGIDTFNNHARSQVLTYVAEWKEAIERLGRWVDFDGSYKTMDNSYIESVWWALGELHRKSLIYQGTRVLPYCPRCETPIAQSEIAMDQGSYKDIPDLSVYVKTELIDEPGTFLVVWTTTPWTLPGNTAAAVNPDLIYAMVEQNGERYIVSKSLVEKIFPDRPPILKEMPGEALFGKAYRPPFPYFEEKDFPNKANAWKVYPASYVSDDQGSGIVHLAPAFGEEDMELAKQFQIPFVWHVDGTGKFTSEVTDFAGQPFKPKGDHQRTDIEIVKYLAAKGTLLKKETIRHSYPHCYRCETPLYYYAIPAWFVKISELKHRLAELNEDIHWVPAHLKHGRFGKSMAGAPDWNISRNRYWASPLPIWQCSTCAATRFVTSTQEFADQTASRNRFFVIRHGWAENNQEQVNDASRGRLHLTAEGRTQVLAAAHELKDKGITKIVTSPVARCRETAQLIADELGLQVQEDDRLWEIHTGVFDGDSVENYQHIFSTLADHWTVRPEGGETWQDVTRRMREIVCDLNTQNQGETILVVSHGDDLWLLEAALQGLDHPNTIKQVPYPKQAEVRAVTVTDIDLHRPWIDQITFPCDCGGTMTRIPEVFDCWFESGSMPFAANHYPFEHKEAITDNFPADFVAEYIAQTRTWFYYMHVMGTVLFDKAPFHHVVTTGNVLAEDGQKMSKSKKNYPDPLVVFDRYGADAVRFYLLGSPLMRSEDINFSERGVDEVFKRIVLRLKNVVSFYTLYPSHTDEQQIPTSTHLLDRWIVSRTYELIGDVTAAMDRYQLDDALRPIDRFIDDLSVWYLRRSRERLNPKLTTDATEADREAAAQTLRWTLVELSKVLAPFTPFLAEEVYQKVKGPAGRESVHLEDWTEPADIDRSLLTAMEQVRELVSLGLDARTQAGLKVRQPLASATLIGVAPLAPELEQVLLDELNVHAVAGYQKGQLAVKLETTLTPELKREGWQRELIRQLQLLRKNLNVAVAETIHVRWQSDDADLVVLMTDSKLQENVPTTKLQRGQNLSGEPVQIDGKIIKFEAQTNS